METWKITPMKKSKNHFYENISSYISVLDYTQNKIKMFTGFTDKSLLVNLYG